MTGRIKCLTALTALFLTCFNNPTSAACEQFKLSASDANTDDRFGVSVAIEGNIAVIGAYRADSNGLDSGAAYVFELSDAGWIEKQMTPSDVSAGDNFGRSVAVEANTIVVGSHLHDDPCQDSGSVYVFTRSANDWSQQQKLTASDAVLGDKFGFSVSIDNNTIVIGAYGDANYTGSAYVFFRAGPAWSFQQKLTASDPNQLNYFGYSVAIDANTIIVGAYNSNPSSIPYAGSAYIFTRSGQLWSQQAVLRASDPFEGDHFGYSVAIDADLAVVGAYECDINGVTDVGAAYVFDRTDTGWIQQQKLFNTVNPNADDDFGRAVAIEGDTVLIGCPNYHFDDEKTGAVFEFTRSGGSWIQQSLLVADDANAGDEFGFSVALSGRRLIAGAHYSGDNVGSAYVFTRPVADLDRNCAVDFADFADLGGSWLQNNPLRDIAPPPTGDGIVDIYDLALLCYNWLIVK
jgi:hypothetical protein